MNTSRRTKQLLYGLSAGLTLVDIATQLKISPRTADHHRRELSRKLKQKNGNIVKLLRAAIAQGKLPAEVLSIPVPVLLRIMKGR